MATRLISGSSKGMREAALEQSRGETYGRLAGRGRAVDVGGRRRERQRRIAKEDQGEDRGGHVIEAGNTSRVLSLPTCKFSLAAARVEWQK